MAVISQGGDDGTGAARLSFVPDRERIEEVFGWLPGIWGAFFLVVACSFPEGATRPSGGAVTAIFLVSALLGALLSGYEIRRRRHPTVLVKAGDRISVYRNGALDMSLAPGEVFVVEADFVAMIKIGVPLALAALLFTALGIDFVARGYAARECLPVVALAAALWATLASAARARFRCAHLRLPVRGSRWLEEDLMVPRSRLMRAGIDVAGFGKR